MTPPTSTATLREVALVVLLGGVVYLGVALGTYWPGDPGYSHTGSGEEIVNLGGRVGAWTADLLFTGFGRMAYLVLLLICAFGWRAWRGPDTGGDGIWQGLLPFAGFWLTLIGACGLEQLYFPLPAGSALGVNGNAGGIVGHATATSLTANFGLVGATVLFIAVFTAGVTLCTRLSWLELMDRIGYQAFTFGRWLSATFEQRADHHEGARVRKARRASVDQLRAELRERKQPTIEARSEASSPGERRHRESQSQLFTEPTAGGELPPLSLLEAAGKTSAGYSHDELESMSRLLVKKLKDFNVEIVVEAVQPGPVITRFEVEPAPGVKASQIVGLARDLARSLSVESVRVVDNIAGKTVIGIEIPNQSRETVRLLEGLSSREYERSTSPLTLVLGKDIAGSAVITDLTKMPHVLIAGTTGSGKSVCLNALIVSLVYKSVPEQVRMIMVDPKFLELSVYDGIPHLLAPVVTDMNKAANALRWCITEMDRRFRLMAAVGVRNISGYNKKVAAAIAAGEPLDDPIAAAAMRAAASEDDDDAPSPPPLTEIPYIVVIVDELADLMMVVGKKVEEIIIRIAQRARAAGIHLVLATQRPSVDVVTGLIKANVPTRIAFQVSSRADSRTVLDQMGAEQLLGHGDMLFLPPGTGLMQRVHGSFVSDDEVSKVVANLKSNAGPGPVYLDEITTGGAALEDGGGGVGDEGGESDELYDDAVAFVTKSRRASISSLQRALRVGYNRAARMIESMEESGVVGPSDNGKREVLAPAPVED